MAIYLHNIFPIQHQIREYLRETRGGYRPDYRMPEPPKMVDYDRMDNFNRMKMVSVPIFDRKHPLGR